MNNPKWRQIGRGTVLCTALAFCLALQACAPAEVRDDLPVVGPFAEAVGDDRYAFEPLDIDQPYNLEVINLHGGIRIRKAPADEAFARVSYPDSHKPGATMMTIKDGRHRLWLLDTLDAKNDDFPECPVQQHDNTVKRLGPAESVQLGSLRLVGHTAASEVDAERRRGRLRGLERVRDDGELERPRGGSGRSGGRRFRRNGARRKGG